jgi:hypothetical protein
MIYFPSGALRSEDVEVLSIVADLLRPPDGVEPDPARAAKILMPAIDATPCPLGKRELLFWLLSDCCEDIRPDEYERYELVSIRNEAPLRRELQRRGMAAFSTLTGYESCVNRLLGARRFADALGMAVEGQAVDAEFALGRATWYAKKILSIKKKLASCPSRPRKPKASLVQRCLTWLAARIGLRSAKRGR